MLDASNAIFVRLGIGVGVGVNVDQRAGPIIAILAILECYLGAGAIPGGSMLDPGLSNFSNSCVGADGGKARD